MRGDGANRASDLSMGAEEEVESSARCPMGPGKGDLVAVLVEPCMRTFMLQIDINGAELLRDSAYKCLAPALPPSANNCCIGARVPEAPDG